MAITERISLRRYWSSREEAAPPKQTVMGYTGDIAVIDNLVNHVPGKNIACIFLGGAQGGIHQAGVAEVIANSGLADDISTYIGVSCGSAAVYGILSGCVNQIKDIYHEENIDYELFKLTRFRKIFNRDALEEALREKVPNHNYLKSRKPNFFAPVTDAITGKGYLIDIKRQNDPLRAIMGAMNMPIVNDREAVELHDVYGMSGEKIADAMHVIDGGLTNPLPLFAAVKRLNPPPTDILVVDTMPLGRGNRQVELLAYLLNAFGAKSPLVKNLMHTRDNYIGGVPYIEGRKHIYGPDGNRINVMAIHPVETAVGMFTMDRDILKQAAAASRDYTQNLFDSCRKAPQLSPSYV